MVFCVHITAATVDSTLARLDRLVWILI